MQRKIVPDVVRQRYIVTLGKNASVHDAVQAMSTHRISAIAVTNGEGHLTGIVSERDMTHRVLACGLNPLTTTLADVMTENPETLRPNDSALDAVELMMERNIRHLPVVTEEGYVVAMISVRDLLKAALDDMNEAIEAKRQEAFAPGSASEND